MASEETILACYSWQTGTCFRCARTHLDTSPIGQVIARSGEVHDVRACRACLLNLEASQQRTAERHGEEYEPGQLGRDGA